MLEGSLVKLDRLGDRSIVNWKELRRLYKLNDDPIVKQFEAERKKVQLQEFQDEHDLDQQLHNILDRLVSVAVAVKSVAA